MRKFSYLLLLAAISFVGCSKDDAGDDITPEVNEQGKIELSISFSNPILNKYFQFLKESDETGYMAIVDARAKLTSEEREGLTNISSGNWMLLQEFLNLPVLKNEILFTANEFRTISAGINYQEERKWNITDNAGKYYVTNGVGQDFSFDLTADFFSSIPTSYAMKTVYYDKTETSGTTTIAGLDVKKITYTLKEDRTEGLKSILVHTSSAIDNAFNSFHPYYTEEENGIVRIELNYGEVIGSIIYEVSKIERRNVSSEELTTPTSTNTVDTDSEHAHGEIYEIIHNIISIPMP